MDQNTLPSAAELQALDDLSIQAQADIHIPTVRTNLITRRAELRGGGWMYISLPGMEPAVTSVLLSQLNAIGYQARKVSAPSATEVCQIAVKIATSN